MGAQEHCHLVGCWARVDAHALGVDLHLGFGATGAHLHATPARQGQAQQHGIGEVRDVGDRLATKRGRWVGDKSGDRLMSHRCPHRAFGQKVFAESISDYRETIRNGDPLAGCDSGDLGHHHRRRDAVFVGWCRADEIPQGLLVGEDRTQMGAFGNCSGDPLETGQGFGVMHSISAGHPCEQPR
jgi:hypothetical protein